jgi:hypothetical protein
MHYALIAGYLVLSIAPLLAIALFQNDIAAAAIASDNISNVSRFGTMAIQINEFLRSPAFGIGMGQYPFQVTQLFPSWADTWEFQKWITDPDASFFPSFSLYSRILAELGAVGYAIWLFFCTLLLGKVAVTAHRFNLEHGAFPYIGAAIICGFFGLQFSGWVIASYKIPYIWLVLGLAVAYIRSAQSMESRRPVPRLDLKAARAQFALRAERRRAAGRRAAPGLAPPETAMS